MFGFRYIKTEPTQYVIQYRNGAPRREGAGLAFWYFAPSSSIVVVPTASVNEPFIFPLITADFQDVTVQGQITFRIADPRRTAALLNFTVGPKSIYSMKLSQRLIDQMQVAMRAAVQTAPLTDVLASGETLVGRVMTSLQNHPTITGLGLELLGLSVFAVKSKPETAKALEAEAREALLRRADEAIYARRNAAVEHERTIKENEIATKRSLRERRAQIEREQMDASIHLEEQKKALVALSTANAREEADVRAYAGWAGAATALGVAPPDQAMNAAFPCDAEFLHYFVREPFPSRTTGAALVAGRIPAKEPLTLVSEMAEHGVIFSDGIEADFLEFNAGTRAMIGIAERQGILVT